MKIIIGLGNPGVGYEHTRHNTGFLLLDEVAETWNATFQQKPKFKSSIAEAEIHQEKVLLIKPTTFYNLTGEAAQAIKDFYKLKNSDILVIHDDMALPFGTIRTRLSGSDAGNNGIKSLNQHVGQNYARIRVGIWEEHRAQTDTTDFVLGKLTKSQRELLGQASKNSINPLIKEFVEEGGHLEPHTLTFINASGQDQTRPQE